MKREDHAVKEYKDSINRRVQEKLSPKCPQRYICPSEEKVRIYTLLIISENKKVKIDIIYLYRMTA